MKREDNPLGPVDRLGLIIIALCVLGGFAVSGAWLLGELSSDRSSPLREIATMRAAERSL